MAMASLVSGRGSPLLVTILTLTALIPLTLGEPEVRDINPNAGSIRGGTRLTIKGRDISKDAFSYGNGNEEKGNKVYLRNSTASIECDVLPYWSNSQRIICDTRSASEGTYSLLLFVDGVEVDVLCSGQTHRCRFEYKENRTPYVDNATPPSGTPGTLVQIRGKLYTDIYSTQQVAQSDVGDPDETQEILRVFWGDYMCDLTDPDSGDIYGITLDSNGTSKWGDMIVKPKGTFVESQQFSFLISGSAGRSFSLSSSLKMSGQDKLYHYQTHAEITSVEPSTGSLEGGTELIITGNYFYAYANTTILVEGVPCDIQNISDTVIICITNKGSDTNRTTYPGSRGILWERWSTADTNLDTATFDVTSGDYLEPQVQFYGESPHDVAENYVGRLRGYFVPPRDGEYRFWIRGDDENQLYFSESGDEADMTIICYSPRSSRWFTSHTEQKSDYLSLQAGMPYYLEARVKEHWFRDFVEIGVDFFDVSVPGGVLDTVYNEEQEIRLAVTVQPERQSIRVVDTNETQEIWISYFGCNETDQGDCDPMEYFYVTYNGETTENMFVFASAEELQEELNNLPSIPANCSVVLADDGLNYTYTVTFNTTEDLGLLTVQSNDPFLVDIRVSELSAGAPAGDTSFVFDYGGVQSATLSTTSSAQQVQDALLDMFSVGCQSNGNPSATFLRDFEMGLVHGSESGTRVTDVEPFCGRTSLKNPEWLYQEGETKKDDGSDVNAFRVDFTGRLCFAFKGKIGSIIQLGFRYLNTQVQQVTNEDWYKSDTLDSYDGYTGSWEYECVDMYDLVSNQGWIKDDAYGGTGLYVTSIKLPTPDADNPLYIDNVFIGSTDNSYTRVQAPADLDGIVVSDLTVTSTSLGFDITMTPGSCTYGFPLLGFQDTSVAAGSAELNSDNVFYKGDGFTMEVTRMAPATVPVSGPFVLSSNGREVEVSTRTSANQMKEVLESFLDTGTVVVHKESSCYESTWDIEWTTKGGRQPILEINGTELQGTNVTAEVTRIVEGRLFMAPIPGEFLRLPYDEPQVEVMVNYIPSTCAVNGSCAFSYDLGSTPEIDSITPTSGSQYNSTSITISGRRFSDDVLENNVTIGGIVCDVTSASETSLECDVGPGAIGNYTVVVNVDSKGFAAYPNGDVQFEYETGVIGVDPENGSTVGGTQITVSGYGFPCDGDADDRVMVVVGDKNCRILSVCYNEIVCKIALGGGSSRRKRSTTADVIVSVDNQVVVTANDLFFYDDSLVLTITDFEPRNSSVFGGGNLTITGLGFGSSDAMVNLGDVECGVLSQSNTEIVCSIPANSPGAYDVEVSVVDKGFADPSSIGKFEYLLQVTSITPGVGSLSGGSKVIITGAGFGTDESEVSIEFSDTITCEIETIVDDQIECIIDIEPTVHTVDNLGKHESWGVGYKWNPQFADVRVGDIVNWQWTVRTYVNGISYTVHQTADADATDYNGSGFYAGSGRTQGSYAFKFGSPGIYYYSSNAVDGGSLYMKGVVRVGPQPSQAKTLSLFVGDYEAEYITDSDSLMSCC
ncbi:fibrocystin-L-like [Amphiura filiformis]|uniref:fibrocystin-L-like n=1 Tax=Amphiura filiformis TaxID=82378 RepID=UPI003B215A6D